MVNICSFIILIVYRSSLQTGICDCLDGSDEYHTPYFIKCYNHCGSEDFSGNLRGIVIDKSVLPTSTKLTIGKGSISQDLGNDIYQSPLRFLILFPVLLLLIPCLLFLTQLLSTRKSIRRQF